MCSTTLATSPFGAVVVVAVVVVVVVVIVVVVVNCFICMTARFYSIAKAYL